MQNRPVVLFVALALVLGGGGFGFKLWRDGANAEAAMQRIVDDVDAAVGGERPDGNELSRLTAKLESMPATDRRVPLLLGRIEVARGHYERAARHLEPLVQIGSGDLAELRAASIAWQSWHARGSKPSDRAELGRRALELAEAAFARSDAVEDLFRAWQAAVRLPDDEAQKRLRETIAARFDDTLPGRTVRMVTAEKVLEQSLAAVGKLIEEWGHEPPVELLLLQAVLELQNDQVPAAVNHLTVLLGNAPNIVEVRHFAATAFHAVAATVGPGPEHDRNVRMRDEQLAWLDANAAPDDRRRNTWLSWRQAR